MNSKVKGKEESKGEKKIDDSSSSSSSLSSSALSSCADHKFTNIDKDNKKEKQKQKPKEKEKRKEKEEEPVIESVTETTMEKNLETGKNKDNKNKMQEAEIEIQIEDKYPISSSSPSSSFPSSSFSSSSTTPSSTSLLPMPFSDSQSSKSTISVNVYNPLNPITFSSDKDEDKYIDKDRDIGIDLHKSRQTGDGNGCDGNIFNKDNDQNGEIDKESKKIFGDGQGREQSQGRLKQEAKEDLNKKFEIIEYDPIVEKKGRDSDRNINRDRDRDNIETPEMLLHSVSSLFPDRKSDPLQSGDSFGDIELESFPNNAVSHSNQNNHSMQKQLDQDKDRCRDEERKETEMEICQEEDRQDNGRDRDSYREIKKSRYHSSSTNKLHHRKSSSQSQRYKDKEGPFTSSVRYNDQVIGTDTMRDADADADADADRDRDRPIREIFDQDRDHYMMFDRLRIYKFLHTRYSLLFSLLLNIICSVASLFLSGYVMSIFVWYVITNDLSDQTQYALSVPFIWTALFLFGTCLFAIAIVGFHGTRKVHFDLLLDYFWGVVLLVAPLVVFSIGSFWFVTYCKVWLKFYWSSETLYHLRLYYCDRDRTGNGGGGGGIGRAEIDERCLVPVGASLSEEENWCTGKGYASDCYIYRDRAQSKAIDLLAFLLYSQSVIGLVNSFGLVFSIHNVNALLSRAVVMKYANQNMSTILMIPIILCIIVSLWLNYHNNFSDDHSVYKVQCNVNAFFFLVSAILSYYGGKYKVAWPMKCYFVVALFNVSLLLYSLVSGWRSTTSSHTVDTSAGVGKQACLMGIDTCGACPSNFDESFYDSQSDSTLAGYCPEWSASELDIIIDLDFFIVTLLAVLCLIYCTAGLFVGSLLHENLKNYVSADLSTL